MWPFISKIFDVLHADLNSQIGTINQKLETIMETLETFRAMIARIDAATNAIAAQLLALKDKIGDMGLSASDEALVFAELEATAKKLEAVGKEEPEPEPEPGP